MSKIYKVKEQVVVFILRQQLDRGTDSVANIDFRDYLLEISPPIVNQAIKELEDEGAVEEIGGVKGKKTEEDLIVTYPYTFWDVSITPYGWLKYASLVDVDPKTDIEALSQYIHDHGEATIDTLTTALNGLPALRIRFAAKQLKSQRKIVYDEDQHPLTFKWTGKRGLTQPSA
jgi:hypothetical protein